MDDFDRFWEWANKPLDSGLTIPADIHHTVKSLPPEARRDRAKVNEALRMVQETAVEIPRYTGRNSDRRVRLRPPSGPLGTSGETIAKNHVQRNARIRFVASWSTVPITNVATQ
jgi:hypothetical protein